MKTKIKKCAYWTGSALLLTVPMAAMAQFQADPGNTGLTSSSIMEIVRNLMYWVLALVGILGVLGFAISGILYLTAAGDEGRIETAKKAMIYSIVGVIVALLGLVILRAVQNMLGARSNF
jgi:hypothetical protein